MEAILYGPMNNKSNSSPSIFITVWILWGLTAMVPFPSPVHALEFTLSDTSPRRGEVVSVHLFSRENCRPVVRYRARAIPVHKMDTGWQAMIGIDLEADTGRTFIRAGTPDCGSNDPLHRQPLHVRPGNYRVQRLSIENESQVQLSAEALERVRREDRSINRALTSTIDKRLWRRPFSRPVANASPGRGFGARRVINGRPRDPHGGEDYGAEVGDSVRSIAAGRVSLTGHFFFEGRAVFINHGHGLRTMYFHLSEITVEEGTTVTRGQKIGEAGTSGRTTGPHLHLGVRLHGATVDPDELLFPAQ
jgi:hypothetical protein